MKISRIKGKILEIRETIAIVQPEDNSGMIEIPLNRIKNAQVGVSVSVIIPSEAPAIKESPKKAIAGKKISQKKDKPLNFSFLVRAIVKAKKLISNRLKEIEENGQSQFECDSVQYLKKKLNTLSETLNIFAEDVNS
ncbi:MAG: hypothetical protein HQM10_05465 [Candidatus Riflebacteria bacterium]|nr:hypothetical protein [Candidatus Riflebacteria bacterium]